MPSSTPPDPSDPLSSSINELGTFSSSEPHSRSTEASASSALDIEPLSSTSLGAIRRLSRYRIPAEPIAKWRDGRGRAAVLVALFGSRDGENLNVLLSTRSKTLRSFPGQVALPGGKQDPGGAHALVSLKSQLVLRSRIALADISLEATARREAFEEVGLPISPYRIRYLCQLPPFLSRNLLLVTPIVCFVLDYSLKPTLNPSEVTRVFSFPLAGFLSSTRPFSTNPTADSDDHSTATSTPSSSSLPTTTPTSFSSFVSPSSTNEDETEKPYHSTHDYPWYSNKPHRFHAFTGRPSSVEGQDTPMITGLTASILIKVAEIAYGRPTEFENHAPGQLSMGELIKCAMIRDRDDWEKLHGPIPEEVEREIEESTREVASTKIAKL